MSRRTTCSRALRSRTRNTPGDPLTSNSSVPLTPTLGPGDARDMSADMSVATMSDFSVCDDVSGSSDTRNCAILCSNKHTLTWLCSFKLRHTTQQQTHAHTLHSLSLNRISSYAPIHPAMWQPRTYFFYHYNVLFKMNLHSTAKSKYKQYTNSWLYFDMFVFYDWPFPRVCTELCKEYSP